MSIMQFFIATILTAIVLITPLLAEEKNHLKELDKLKYDITNLKKSLTGDAESQESLNNQLKTTELILAEAELKVRALEKKLNILNLRINDLNEQKINLFSYLKDQKLLIKKYISSLHHKSDSEPIRLLLNQKDPKNINRVLKYYNYFAAARGQKIKAYEIKINELKSVKESISNQKVELLNSRSELNAEKIGLFLAQNNRAITIKKLNKKIHTSRLKLAAYTDQRAGLEALLANNKSILQELPTSSTRKNFIANKGLLPWPVKGQLSNGYSPALDSSLHSKGWLLKTAAGTPVSAVHDGKIVFSGYLKGHGLLIIVSHGGGYMTLYAHNQFLLKNIGDWVLKGERIARVGNTGGLSEHALYFEIRQDGKTSNPKIWLQKENY